VNAQSNVTRAAVFAQVRDAFVELFDMDAARVVEDARLYEDLEIDSIDAVDLLDRVKRQTGLKISASDFRAVRTVRELVDALHRLMQA
jgi:acyl carrier protein